MGRVGGVGMVGCGGVAWGVVRVGGGGSGWGGGRAWGVGRVWGVGRAWGERGE